MEIEQGFMRPAILHGFGTSAKQRLPTRLAELAQFGWLPLAAALFGTADWQPQWLHHNFLPVIGLRVHAKIPPSPLSYQQTVSLLGLWERRATLGSQCRALTCLSALTDCNSCSRDTHLLSGKNFRTPSSSMPAKASMTQCPGS